MADNETIFKVTNLRVCYGDKENKTVAIDNINLDIKKNQFTVILGSSGSGKTTLLNCLGGILRPESGSIFYKNEDITKYNFWKLNAYRRDHIGFVFQNYNLISSLTAKHNVDVSASLSNNTKGSMKALDTVGLRNKAQKYPSQMSGGEQQRVSIARALVKNADIILCDEPTGALDTKNANHVLRILQDLVEDNKVSAVMITHNPLFEKIAHHCIIMSNGHIEEERFNDNPHKVEELELK